MKNAGGENGSARTFRNSPRHIWGVWVTRMVPTILGALLLLRLSDTLNPILFLAAFCLFSVLTLAALLEPIWDAQFRKLKISQDRLTLETGWLFPEVRHTRLDQITSAQVNEPLSQRLSGVQMLTISASGAEKNLRMPALVPSDCEDLMAIISTHRQAHDGVLKEPRTASKPLMAFRDGESSDSPLIYEASIRDMAATAVSSGYPLVVVAGAAGVVEDLGEWTNLSTIHWTDPRTIVLGLAGLAVVMAVATWVKYYKFRIERSSQELVVSYGALERMHHAVAEREMAAVTMVRSPIDLLFGTTRVVISTARLRQENSGVLTFPSMATQTARQVVENLLGRPVPELFVRRPWWLVFGPLIIISATLLVAYGLGRYHIALAIGGALLTLVGSSVLIRYLSGRVALAATNGLIIWSDVALASRVTAYRNRSLTLLVERRLPGAKWANLTLIGWAHARVTHRCLVGTEKIYESLSKLLTVS